MSELHPILTFECQPSANPRSSPLSLTSPQCTVAACLLRNPQYGEFRSGYDKDTSDTRLVWYGLRYIVENYLLRQWTVEDVERADLFFRHVMPCYNGSCISGAPGVVDVHLGSSALHTILLH